MFSSVVLLLACSAFALENAKTIILVLVDDLGAADLGFTGNSDVPTPAIDALRAGGQRFERGYVQPVCSPSRSAIMTSVLPIRTGGQHYVYQPGTDEHVPLNISFFIPEVLAAAGGWSRHVTGKWHLGMDTWHATPNFRGFESFVGFLNGGEDYFTHITSGGYDMRRSLGGSGCGLNCSFPAWDLQGNYSTEIFGRRAVEVIEAHDPSQSNLFLYLPFQGVHAPDEVPSEYLGPCSHIVNDEKRKTYCGMLYAVDVQVGALVDALKKKGMFDSNLLFILASDNNGPIAGSSRCKICGDHTGASNWPLRGGKHSLWEGGTRGISFVYGSPDVIPASRAGKNVTGMMHFVDYLPTIAHFAGADVQAALKNLSSSYGIDGMDMYDMIVGLNMTSPRQDILLNYDPLHNINGPMDPNNSGGNAAIVSTDVDPESPLRYWKLHIGDPGPPDVWSPANSSAPGLSMPRTTQSSVTTMAQLAQLAKLDATADPLGVQLLSSGFEGSFLPNTTMLLFDVSDDADPYETTNVAASHASIVAALSAKIYKQAARSVPPDFCYGSCKDPAGDPKNFNGTWTPWKP